MLANYIESCCSFVIIAASLRFASALTALLFFPIGQHRQSMLAAKIKTIVRGSMTQSPSCGLSILRNRGIEK
tara:strand:- start:724 stop:939 length:216 start_codon:yes stop_codon:yes gene_type:complete